MLLSQIIRELELCSSVMLMVDIITICSNSADRSVCYKHHSLLSVAYQPHEYVSCRSTIHLELLLLFIYFFYQHHSSDSSEIRQQGRVFSEARSHPYPHISSITTFS